MGVNGQPLVLFSTQAWSDYWVSKHWIADTISNEKVVLFIEPPRRISVKGLFKGSLWSPEIKLIKNNLYAITPYTLPFPFRIPWFLRPCWRAPLHKQIASALESSGITRFCVLAFDPHAYPLIDRLKGRVARVVYYAVDPPLGVEDKRWPERQFVKQADEVLAVTGRLANRLAKESGRDDVQVLPHGIDVGKSQDISNEMESDFPAFCGKIGTKKPIIGYTGAIHDVCVNFDLIVYATKRKPEWEFVLVGPYSGSELDKKGIDIDKYKGIPNLHFLGGMPFSKLKLAINKFDVCIVPYRSDIENQWERRSPFKLLHYFAQGKPVVISDVPAAEDYGNLVYSYHSYDQFVQSIEKALSEDESRPKRRIEWAEERDFSVLVEKLKEYLAESEV